MDEWEQEQEQARKEDETFRRIHRLIKHGYFPDWSGKDEGAIWFNHPGRGPDLIFYPSGMLVAFREGELRPGAGDDKDRIYNFELADVDQFDQWLNSFPSANWWQRGAPERMKYIWYPVFIGIIALIGWGLSELVRSLWRMIT